MTVLKSISDIIRDPSALGIDNECTAKVYFYKDRQPHVARLKKKANYVQLTVQDLRFNNK